MYQDRLATGYTGLQGNLLSKQKALRSKNCGYTEAAAATRRSQQPHSAGVVWCRAVDGMINFIRTVRHESRFKTMIFTTQTHDHKVA